MLYAAAENPRRTPNRTKRAIYGWTLNNYDPAHYILPGKDSKIRVAINNYDTMLGKGLFSTFMTPQLNKANVLLLTHMSSSRNFLELKNRILVYARDHLSENVKCEVTEFGMALSSSSRLLTSGQIKI